MKISVLGTGDVGRTIGKKLCELEHEVHLGSRSGDNDKATAWRSEVGARGHVGTFAESAAFSDGLVFHCTQGATALAVLDSAGSANLKGKVLVDVSNPLDFSGGFPPKLSVMNDDSLAEQIQRAHPETKVVKALNTMGHGVMVQPSMLEGPHDLLLCGDDADAKAQVQALLRTFGWKHLIDVGPLSAARGLEAWLLLWTRLYGALGTADFNLHLVKKAG